MGAIHPVSFKTDDGRHYLCAEPDGRVVADRTAVGAWEEWAVEPLDGGAVALKSAHGRYLCAEPDGTVIANREAIGSWERWTVVVTDFGVGLRSEHGGFLVAEMGGGREVKADRRYSGPGPWETFTPSQPLRPGTGGQPPTGEPLTRMRVESNKRWFANARGRFDWREVSAFSLLARLLAGEEDLVRAFIRLMRAYGFTVLRGILTLDGDYWTRSPLGGRSFRSAPDMPGYWQMLDRLVAIAAEEGMYLRVVFLGAVEPFGGVWHPDRRDVWNGDVRRRGEAFVVEAAQRLAAHPHVIGELANEPGQIGMRESFDALIALGRKVKAVAPDMLLCAGAPDGGNESDIRFIVRPFDFADAHFDRLMGVRGFEWVKRTGEMLPVDQPSVYPERHPLEGRPTGIEPMPFVSGEPLNFGEARADGRTGDVERSRAVAFTYGGVSRARHYNTCFHYDGGLWTTEPKPDTVECIRAYMAALDAFPMLTSQKWRGHWGLSAGDYWRDVWPDTDDLRQVERHVSEGRGAWRAYGSDRFSIVFPLPENWPHERVLEAPAERLAYVGGNFGSAIFERR